MVIIRTKRHKLPGFRLSLGVTLGWLGFLVVFPVFVMMIRSFTLSPDKVIKLLTRPAALYAFEITFRYALLTSLCNSIIGLVIAWTVTRYKFFGHRFFDSLIDLPFALPGAVGGIALASVFSTSGIVGGFINSLFPTKEITLVYNQFGIFIGLLFVTLPFAVRSIQPLIRQLDKNEEQAALVLGARKQNVFFRIQLPTLIPGIISGFILTFARSIGEYGTVIFVAGNIPLKSEVLSRYIYNKIDQYDLEGAMVVASVLMLISLTMLVVINILQAYVWKKRRNK